MSSNRSDHLNRQRFSVLSINSKESIFLKFLYQTKIGRCVLTVLIQPNFSKLIGWFLNKKISCLFIGYFCKKNKIQKERYETKKYRSFNDFFSRKLKETPHAKAAGEFCSPCDGKLLIYPIDESLEIKTKHSIYTVSQLLQDAELAKEYEHGMICIFRLTPDDYHRYHFFDEGEILLTKKIKGVLHTVRPIAMREFPVFHENARELSILETKHFGKVIQVEVGALMVGKIRNTPKKTFHSFEEKGYFEFGGSTIILLFQKNRVHFLNELLENTQQNLETIVSVGDQIGECLR